MLSSDIKAKALSLGYSACGIIPPVMFDKYKIHLNKRVKDFPQSRELYEPLYDMTYAPVQGKAVIVCVQPYDMYKIPDALAGHIGKFYLFDVRLPYSPERRARSEFETYLKTGGLHFIDCPVPARWAAALAGTGKFTRNNFICDSEHGSYIWLETWVVDKELEFDNITEDILHPKCVEGCQKCVKACPTKALSDSFSMDRGKCIAQLSFHSTELPSEQLRDKMDGWLYGCDICQDVCPLNKKKFTKNNEYPLLNEYERYLEPEKILEMDEDTYKNILQPRFWYIGPNDLWLWKCNALRTMINSGDKKYHKAIKQSLSNDDPRICETAHQGCVKLGI